MAAANLLLHGSALLLTPPSHTTYLVVQYDPFALRHDLPSSAFDIVATAAAAAVAGFLLMQT